ncbi:MAG: hypothetical protein LBO72_01325 [Helicobacteraceae bacterium]|jgi:tetratricopeptide (TPR) repeat protein|nr:hypothetical protein [Helicobacteraceae bacterium]
MDRIDRLERSWIIYKTKKIARNAVFFGFALIIGATIVYVALRNIKVSSADANAQDQVSQTQSNAAVQTSVAVTPDSQPASVVASNNPKPTETQTPTQAKPKMSIAPNYDFANDADKRVAASIVAVRTQPPPAPAIVNPTPTPPVANPSSPVSFQRVDGVSDLVNAFNRQPNYSKAVDIAEFYLKQNDFQNAYDWALKANELNGNDERSWAVFAKASYKMGHRDRAINALKGYLNAKSSANLSKLLYQIERDEEGI